MTLSPGARAEARRIIHFLAAGMLNTAFGYSAYALCLALGSTPPLAVVISTIAGICFNFRTLGAVFAGRGHSRLLRFVAVYATVAPLNILLIDCGRLVGLDPYLGGALALAVIIPLTYLAMRLFVFAPADLASTRA